jgi:hypothetical protein
MMNESSYDNLDNCINYLFNAVYGKSDKCYAIHPIKRKSITIDYLRKPLNFDPSNVFETDFKLINKDKFRINYKRTNKDNTSCNISIGSNSKNQNDLTRPELQNMAMMYMSSELLFNENFKGVILPLMCFDIELDNLIKLFPRIKKDLSEEEVKKLGDKMYVIVTEHYFKMETLGEYLNNNIDKLSELDIKNIFFEIYYILGKMCERFNNFTHGTLDFDSILVVRKSQKERREFKLGTVVFEIESDIELKFTNFDKSSTSDYNNDIQKYNPYYDIHYIASFMYDFLNEHKKITPQIEIFFNEILPEKFRFKKDIKYFIGLNEDEFNMNSDEIITSSVLLKKNKFFKQFIKMDLSVSPQEFKKENTKDLSQKGEGISYIENYKNNKKNKKSNVDYNSMSTYKGSRRIVVPGFSNTGLTSEYSERSNLFTGGSESEMKDKDKKSSSVSTSVTESVTQSVTEKKEDKKSSSSSSATITEKEANVVARALKEATKAKDAKKKSSKHKKEESSMSASVSVSALSISEGGGKKKSSKDKRNLDAMYENLKINPKHAAILKKLPENFLDVAPEGMIKQMPSLEQMESGMGMQGMNGMQGMQGMNGMQGMEGMNPMMGMQQMQQMQQPQLSQADYDKISQMAAYPPMQMPAGLPEGLQSQLQGSQFNSQLNVPMMGPHMGQQMGMPGMDMGMGMGMPGMGMGMPGMQPMMGGASKGTVKKYRLNREEVNKRMTSGFFF